MSTYLTAEQRQMLADFDERLGKMVSGPEWWSMLWGPLRNAWSDYLWEEWRQAAAQGYRAVTPTLYVYKFPYYMGRVPETWAEDYNSALNDSDYNYKRRIYLDFNNLMQSIYGETSDYVINQDGTTNKAALNDLNARRGAGRPAWGVPDGFKWSRAVSDLMWSDMLDFQEQMIDYAKNKWGSNPEYLVKYYANMKGAEYARNMWATHSSGGGLGKRFNLNLFNRLIYKKNGIGLQSLHTWMNRRGAWYGSGYGERSEQLADALKKILNAFVVGGSGDVGAADEVRPWLLSLESGAAVNPPPIAPPDDDDVVIIPEDDDTPPPVSTTPPPVSTTPPPASTTPPPASTTPPPVYDWDWSYSPDPVSPILPGSGNSAGGGGSEVVIDSEEVEVSGKRFLIVGAVAAGVYAWTKRKKRRGAR